MTSACPPVAYRERFVAFIDVLGFGSLISDSGQNDTLAANTIARVSEAIGWSIEELADHYVSPTTDLVFTQFSDSFVISVDAEHAGEYDLSVFLSTILDVIHCFIGSQLLLRGGISRGKLVHTSKLLFGPAMNRAHELESRIAKVPRVILDPNLSQLPDLVLDGRLANDSDGLLYVDYFAPQQAFYLVPSRQHLLQCTIEAIPSSPKLQEKREWLIAKYNAVMTSFLYDEFKSRLDDYVDSNDANNAVVEDYEDLLAPAKKLHRL